MATLKDVARAAGVSVATASRVFSRANPVRKPTRDLVLRAASALGYRPNRAARELVTRAPAATIGVLLDDLDTPHQRGILAGALRRAARSALRLTVAQPPTGGSPEKAQALARSADGFVLACALEEPVVSRLARDIPVVATVGSVQGLPAVTTNERSAIRRAQTHLLGSGHRRLAYAGPRSAVAHWRAAELADLASFDTSEGLEAVARKILDAGVTGILARDDEEARALRVAFSEKGIGVPNEMSLLSLGTPSERGSAAFSRVSAPPSKIGETAAELLLLALRGGHETRSVRTVRIEPELQPGSTMAARP